MQIIQSFLGSKLQPLVMRKSLCNPHNLIWRKEANPRTITSIKPIKSQLGLATSSKFLLPRKHKSLINSLLSWDTTDNQHEDNEFTTFDSIPEQKNKHNNSEEIKNHIPSILQTHIESNDISPSWDTTDNQHEDNEFTTFDLIPEANNKHNKTEKRKDNVPSILQTHIESNDISPKSLKSERKKTSKQTNKSQSKPKSKSKKIVKASNNKDLESKDSLLTVDEIPDEAKHKKDNTLIESELNSKDNTIDDSAFVENTPISTISTSHSIEDKSNLFTNTNNEVQISSEKLSSLPNIDPSKTFNIPDVSKIAPKIETTLSEIREVTTSDTSAIAPKTETTLPSIKEVTASDTSAILPSIREVTASDTSAILPSIREVTASDTSAIAPKTETTLPSISEVTAPKESVTLKSNKSEVITSNLGVTSSEDSELIMPKSAENQTDFTKVKSPEDSEITVPDSIVTLSKDSELITPKSRENQTAKSLETTPITAPEILQQLASEIQFETNILPTQPETNQANKPNSAFTSNVAETPNIFQNIVENKQIIEPEIPSTIGNSELSTTVNTSNISENVSLPEVEQNTPLEDLPAPKGYATGGHVTSYIENNQQIASSDTVPAMLTPGEFVINARDTQKNLDLLQHINSGGTTENTIPIQTPSPTPEQTNGDTSTLQRKSSDTPSSPASKSLTSLGLEVQKQDNTIPIQTPLPTPEQTNGDTSTLQRKSSDTPSSPASKSLTSLGLEVQKQDNTIPIQTPSPTPEQTNGDTSTLQRKSSDTPSSPASKSLTSLGLEVQKQDNTIPIQTPSPTPEQTNGDTSTLQRKSSDTPSSPASKSLTSLGLEVQKQDNTIPIQTPSPTPEQTNGDTSTLQRKSSDTPSSPASKSLTSLGLEVQKQDNTIPIQTPLPTPEQTNGDTSTLQRKSSDTPSSPASKSLTSLGLEVQKQDNTIPIQTPLPTPEQTNGDTSTLQRKSSDTPSSPASKSLTSLGLEVQKQDNTIPIQTPLPTPEQTNGDTSTLQRKSSDTPSSPASKSLTSLGLEVQKQDNTIPIQTPLPTPEQTNGDTSTLQRKSSDTPSSPASKSLTSLGLEVQKQDNTIPIQTPLPTPEQTNGDTSTLVDSFSETSLQRKSSEIPPSPASKSLTSSSLGLEVQKQRLSLLSSPQLNNSEDNTISGGESSVNYSSPTLIFRQTNSTIPSTNTPSQWSSVEELLNGSNQEFTVFHLSNKESNRENSELPEEPTQVFAKQFSSPQGFAEGGKVTKSDISTEIQPVTETVQMPSNVEDDDAANLEALAYEIYMRLRQKLEIERERQGIYVGRLPW